MKKTPFNIHALKIAISVTFHFIAMIFPVLAVFHFLAEKDISWTWLENTFATITEIYVAIWIMRGALALYACVGWGRRAKEMRYTLQIKPRTKKRMGYQDKAAKWLDWYGRPEAWLALEGKINYYKRCLDSKSLKKCEKSKRLLEEYTQIHSAIDLVLSSRDL